MICVYADEVPEKQRIKQTKLPMTTGKLEVTIEINEPPKQVTRLGDSGTQAGATQIIAAASVGPDQVVTAVRTQEGNLKLIVWDISSDGKTVTRLGDSGNQAGVSDQYSGQFLSSESTIR